MHCLTKKNMDNKTAIKEIKSILKDYRDTMTKDLEQALVNYIESMYVQSDTKRKIQREEDRSKRSSKSNV